MKKIVTLLLLTLFVFPVKSQTVPDKIVVVKNKYEVQHLYFFQGDSVFSEDEISVVSDTIVLTRKRAIANLYKELVKFDTEERILEKFKLDTAYILKNPNKLLKLFSGEEEIAWNEKQKEFIFEKLTDLNTYKFEFDQYLSEYTPSKKHQIFSGLCKHDQFSYCSLGMPHYLDEYVILLYQNNQIINTYTSRKSTSGYKFPYKEQSNRVVYNYKIDQKLCQLFNLNVKIDRPLQGHGLLKNLVNRIIDNNVDDLQKLSPYSYEKEISELKTDFDIISSEEVNTRGRYLWDEPQTMQITLKNKYMLPQVYLQFMDSRYGDTLYSRDSIKKDYRGIISRVQAIPFITNYLQQDTSAHLDIYYFNHSGLNQYNIDGINTNPTEWEKCDVDIERLKLYKKNNPEPEFDVEESIKTSEELYCGCNYRFDYDFISQAIFIEIMSSRNASSIWFLLPDDTLLLYHAEVYHLESAKVLDMALSKFGASVSLPFACLRFDKNGTLIEKEH